MSKRRVDRTTNEQDDGSRRARTSLTKRRGAGLLAAGSVLGGVVAGGVAWAAIPNNGVITACYQKSDGTLRVVDATTSTCNRDETTLSWNAQGVPGPPGPAGPPGPIGISGYELVSETETATNPFAPNQKSVVVNCPAGKEFLGGGYNFYILPPAHSPSRTAPERGHARPENVDGHGRYTVTVVHPVPDDSTSELTATVACADVAP